MAPYYGPRLIPKFIGIVAEHDQGGLIMVASDTIHHVDVRPEYDEFDYGLAGRRPQYVRPEYRFTITAVISSYMVQHTATGQQYTRDGPAGIYLPNGVYPALGESSQRLLTSER